MPNKRANGEGNIRKVRRGDYEYWEARYTAGTNLATGKQIQRSKYFKTQKEAKSFLQHVSTELEDETYIEPNKITVSQWLDIWLGEYCVDLKYNTVKHYKAMCENHIKPYFGNVKLCTLKTTQIQKFYNYLATSGKISKAKNGSKAEPAPLSPKSIRNVHGILTKALNTAVKVGYLKMNPTVNTTIKRAGRKEIHPLNDEQVKQFLSALGEGKYTNVLKVILFTGMRECEAIGLTWDCIDFEKGTIQIEKQLQHRTIDEGGYQFESTKSDRVRVIKPAQFVMDILKEQNAKQIEERMKYSSVWEGWQNSKEKEKALVFLDETGHHLSPKSLYVHYKKVVKDIAPDTCVHDLRHTYAVLSLQNGDDVKTVQQNLGHATASFTLDVYGHVSDTMRDESASRMQKYIDRINAV